MSAWLLAGLAALALAPSAQATRTIRITTPAPGSTVALVPHVRHLSATLTVRGRAERGARVQLRARCALGPCTATATADAKGRWRAQLHVVVPRDRGRVGIRALYAGTLEGSDLVAPRVRLPSWAVPFTAGRPELAVIGDSLAEGTAAPLRAELPGWWVTTDARRSRPLAEGMAVLARTPLPATRVILAFSLFTNNAPSEIEALDAAVRTSVTRLRPGACALWATIVRPKFGDTSYREVNQRLEALASELAGRLVVVDWAAAVRRNPEWLADDRVHATAEGYAARARLYADAARACAA